LTALVVAACGGGSGSSPSAGGTPSASTSPGAGFAANFGTVSGKILSISAAGAAVQSTNGTTTIAWATSTQFSKVSAVSLSSLAKGDCVTVATGAKSAAAAATKITATTVSVTSTSGCTQRGGFGGGGFPGGGTPPSGSAGGSSSSPRPFPTGSPGSRGGFGGGGFPGRGRGFGGTFGTIASISKSSFVVTSVFGSTTVKVKTTSSTTFTTTSSTTSAAIVTGQCASAIGTKTSNGTIDARTITISSPQNGKCANTGFGGFPGGFGGGFGGGRGGFGSSPPVTSA
jgi:hypothetical protein